MGRVKEFGQEVLHMALVSAGGFRAAEKEDPKYSIKEVMKMAHTVEKGSKDPSLYQKVADGKATKDDKAKLLELYSALPANKPPKGDADAGKKSTTATADAAKAVADGKEDSKQTL